MSIPEKPHDEVAYEQKGSQAATVEEALPGKMPGPGQSAALSGILGFAVMMLGQVISVLGTRMTNFAVGIWAWQHTGQASTLSLITFFSFLPTFICTPLAGALIDRWPRKLTIILSDAGSVIATAIMLFLFYTKQVQIWELYALNAFMGVFIAFQYPAYGSVVTIMVKKEQYTRANGMRSLVQSVSAVIAPALGAILLSISDINSVLLIDVVTYLLAIGTVLIVHIPRVKRSEEHAQENIWLDSIYGFRYMLRNASLLWLQIILSLVGFVVNTSWILFTPLILARSGNSDLVLGIVMATGAIGGLVGSGLLSILKAPRNKIHGILISSLLFCLLGRVVLGLSTNVVVWSFCWFTTWLLSPFMDGYSLAIWQEKTPPALQGRLFAARQVTDDLFFPISLLIAGPLADAIFEPALRPGGSLAGLFGGLVGTGPGSGIALIFVITGVLGVLISLLGYMLRSVREIEYILPDYGETAQNAD